MATYDFEKAHALAYLGTLPPEVLGYYREDAEAKNAHQESVFRYYLEAGEAQERPVSRASECGCREPGDRVFDVQPDGGYLCRGCKQVI